MRRLHDIPPERRVVDRRIFGDNSRVYTISVPEFQWTTGRLDVPERRYEPVYLRFGGQNYDANMQQYGTFNVTWEYTETA